MENRVGRPKKEIDNVIGQRIKIARKSVHLTQEALATKLEVTTDTIRNWENSRSTPSDYTYYHKIAQVCGTTVEHLTNTAGKKINGWIDKAKFLGDFLYTLGDDNLSEITNHLNKLSTKLKEPDVYNETSKYIKRVLKQNILMMDDNIDEDEFLIQSLKNARENYKHLQKIRSKQDEKREDKQK